VTALLRFLHLLALGVWIGEIVFFSFVVAPTLFRTLDPNAAGQVVSAIFPRYYALGTAAGIVALATGIVLARSAGASRWGLVTVGVVALGLAATVWAGWVVQPEAHRLRAAMQAAGESSPEAAAFKRLHARAVTLNVAALVAALAALGCSTSALRS
jgi:uncharacterized membrane protein